MITYPIIFFGANESIFGQDFEKIESFSNKPQGWQFSNHSWISNSEQIYNGVIFDSIISNNAYLDFQSLNDGDYFNEKPEYVSGEGIENFYFKHTGVSFAYFPDSNANFVSASDVRKENYIYKYWGNQFPLDNFYKRDYWSARITAEFIVPEDGEYIFYADHNDSVRILIGQIQDGNCANKEIINTLSTPNDQETESSPQHLKAGKCYLLIDYYDIITVAKLILKWKGPNFPKRLMMPTDFGLDNNDAAYTDYFYREQSNTNIDETKGQYLYGRIYVSNEAEETKTNTNLEKGHYVFGRVTTDNLNQIDYLKCNNYIDNSYYVNARVFDLESEKLNINNEINGRYVKAYSDYDSIDKINLNTDFKKGNYYYQYNYNNFNEKSEQYNDLNGYHVKYKVNSFFNDNAFISNSISGYYLARYIKNLYIDKADYNVNTNGYYNFKYVDNYSEDSVNSKCNTIGYYTTLHSDNFINEKVLNIKNLDGKYYYCRNINSFNDLININNSIYDGRYYYNKSFSQNNELITNNIGIDFRSAYKYARIFNYSFDDIDSNVNNNGFYKYGIVNLFLNESSDLNVKNDGRYIYGYKWNLHSEMLNNDILNTGKYIYGYSIENLINQCNENISLYGGNYTYGYNYKTVEEKINSNNDSYGHYCSGFNNISYNEKVINELIQFYGVYRPSIIYSINTDLANINNSIHGELIYQRIMDLSINEIENKYSLIGEYKYGYSLNNELDSSINKINIFGEYYRGKGVEYNDEGKFWVDFSAEYIDNLEVSDKSYISITVNAEILSEPLSIQLFDYIIGEESTTVFNNNKTESYWNV